MGYRSQIAIVVDEKHAEKLTYFIEEIGLPDEEQRTEDGLLLGVYYEDVK